MVVDCYSDAYFAELWGNENTQDPINSSSRALFVVIFDNFPLLWVSRIQTYITLYTLHYKYVALS